ncbi:MAG TPA: sigma-70 family RNA polymerase sigma factor [Prolixibacteraceae bacterium]|nr:sigma-70 family RNA polymerase sigma factor [Prolixibacteraceae bacterium]
MEQFDKIYNDNYRLIFNVVHKMVPDPEDVSDLVQEVFINLYQCLKKEVVIEHPRSWLYKVSLNKCIDFTKKRQKHEKIESFSQLKDEDNPLESHEKQAVVRLALTRLTKEESMLAVLYSEGCSYKEMAEITGIGFTSVGKTLSRTLAKLGNELKKLKYELY